MDKFRKLFEKEEITFELGEPGEKEVYLMVDDYGSVPVHSGSTRGIVIEDLEKAVGRKLTAAEKKLVTKALKELKKK